MSFKADSEADGSTILCTDLWQLEANTTAAVNQRYFPIFRAFPRAKTLIHRELKVMWYVLCIYKVQEQIPYCGTSHLQTELWKMQAR